MDVNETTIYSLIYTQQYGIFKYDYIICLLNRLKEDNMYPDQIIVLDALTFIWDKDATIMLEVSTSTIPLVSVINETKQRIIYFSIHNRYLYPDILNEIRLNG